MQEIIFIICDADSAARTRHSQAVRAAAAAFAGRVKAQPYSCKTALEGLELIEEFGRDAVLITGDHLLKLPEKQKDPLGGALFIHGLAHGGKLPRSYALVCSAPEIGSVSVFADAGRVDLAHNIFSLEEDQVPLRQLLTGIMAEASGTVPAPRG